MFLVNLKYKLLLKFLKIILNFLKLSFAELYYLIYLNQTGTIYLKNKVYLNNYYYFEIK